MSTSRPVIDAQAAPTGGELHLWRFSLDDVPATVATLSADERARAARYRFPIDARRYIAGRAAVRRVLGSYAGCAAGALTFVTNEQGKPALAAATARSLWFNLAHSAHQAVLVVGAHELLGVDVELVRPGFADDEIAERFFAPSEVHQLRALALADQQDAFFRCWTRKEAYIKARGGGLHIPLDSFTVAFRPGDEPGLTAVVDQPEESREWTVRDVSNAVPGAVAALAVRARSDGLEVPVVFDLHG